MKHSRFLLLGAVALLLGCATVAPPDVALLSETHYISPANGDGVKDQLRVPVELATSERMVLQGYRLTVSDRAGTVVRSEESLAPTPTAWKRLTTSVRLGKKEGLPAPEAVVWDGRSQRGAFAPDGEYDVVFEAWDDRGNMTVADPIRVVVDNTAPTVSVMIPYRIFSPNGDGNKDTLSLTHRASREELWQAQIVDGAGRGVAGYSWNGYPPEELIWNGRDEDGAPLPDGVYGYTVHAEDRAGNRGAFLIEGLGINTRPTPISIEIERPAFSPNGDGVADTVRITPIFPTEGLEGYTLELMDEKGEWIRRIEGTAVTSYTWDGRNSAGEIVSDGSYSLLFTAIYENGNAPRVESPPLQVDTVFPRATPFPEYTIFSPDGDGNRDTLAIRHTGVTDERDWFGELLDQTGNVVLRRSWPTTPPDLIWDGRDGRGVPVVDGLYRYRIYATDEGGNSFRTAVEGIRVDRRPTPVSIAANQLAFSPNGDGVQESVEIVPTLTLTEGLEAWAGEIRDSRGRTVRSFRGEGVPAFSWNGVTDAGARAPDGEYTAELRLSYEKGNRPVAVSAPFTVDTQAPRVRLEMDYSLFSPDGDGRRDTITLTPREASREARWTAELLDTRRRVVRQSEWQGVPGAFLWDGRDRTGAMVPDGEYSYRLTATDLAGNAGGATVTSIRLDTRPRPISLSSSATAFSPNGDNVQESVLFRPEAQIADGITNWTLSISNARGEVARSFTGTVLPGEISWDGRNNSRSVVSDGTYRGRLLVTYAQGAESVGESREVTVDTVAPTAQATAAYTLFSPDGDGRRDTVTIVQSNGSEERLWIGAFLNQSGTEVYRSSWPGRPGTFTWDGRDGSTTPLPDGNYRYLLSAVDEAGNRGSTTVTGFRIDRRGTPISITLDAAGFSPDGNGVADTMGLDLSVGLADGIESWELSIEGENGSHLLREGRRGVPPSRVDWDGTVEGRRPANEGSYFAILKIAYEKGNAPEARTAPFLVDLSGPTLALTTEPVRFSPDGDGDSDTLRLRPRASDGSGVASWEIVIRDPYEREFYRFLGEGAIPAAPLQWNGRSRSGELVQSATDYTISFSALDRLGNRSELGRPLPIDILVIREGDRLRIQISSIYFAPFSSAFQPGKEVENQRTLERLAEILLRYPEYQIGVEGHAVRVYWYDENRGAFEERETLLPLSRQRAEVVRQALIELKVPAARMIATGLGGTRPVVPHSDLDNRWKNRRVEFVLQRPR